MFSPSDTIVAIATPAGRGGLGVVRLSGPDAAAIAALLVGRTEPFIPRHATFARIVEPVADRQVRAVDHVIVTRFDAPHSYTGDDVVEISGHGSPVLLRHIVDLAMQAGARLAEPGEFTLRAYLNGRVDLVQAEAVADLVDAVTPLQARVAMDQLEGTLTQAIGALDRALFDLSARLDASLDFPDEGFHFITREETRDALERVRHDAAALVLDGGRGRVVREGRMVVIVGRPNVGKSSLFNALAGAARAIVTEIPGTTRDVLTERIDLAGVAVTLVDTAGMRRTDDIIEAEGVARARQAQQVAGLAVVVLDGSTPLTDDDRELLAGATADVVIGVSKTDLPNGWTTADVELTARVADSGVRIVRFSAVTGDGLDDLRRTIAAELLGREELRDTPQITNVRHLALLDRAIEHLDSAAESLDEGATEELVLVDLARAREALEEITGRRTTEDVLRHIFERFCVGK